MFRPSRTLLLGALALTATSVTAIEGMWQPHQLPRLEAELKAKGLAIDPSRISDLAKHPMNAVIGLGFCTASFVSPLGLIVTNHHCAYGSIQYNSTAERNLLTAGFYAKTLGEELRGEPTLRVYVTESITDVTAAIRDDLAPTLTGRARFDAIDARMKAQVADCEMPGGYRCDVYVFHGGAQYFLIRQMEIRDVRLVYAPPEAIGKFGGDVDNWLWPRHTGDFSFYRAYVSPEGKPADYNEVNVPFQPKSYLKVSDQGLDDGDFVMIAGYPGRTNRYRLAEEVDDAIGWQYPTLIRHYTQILAIIDEQTKARPDAAVKYAASVASFNNGLKNFQGNLDGFAKVDAVGSKRAEEQAILDWAAANKQADAAPGHARIRELLAEQRGRRERDLLWSLLNQSGLMQASRDLYRISVEREKDDQQRELNYQKRDEVRIEGRLTQLERRYDPQVDRALVEYVLGEYVKLPKSARVAEIDAWIGLTDEGKHQIDATLDALYAQTKLGALEERLKWFKADRKAIEQSGDPALKLAAKLYPVLLRIEDQQKTFTGLESLARPQWMAARIAYAEAQGRPLYPDANNSLRVTFGQVQGYSPKDALVYTPFTGLGGIVEKHTGKDPFDATAPQLKAIAERRYGRYADPKSGTVPVNFLADLDITGGNSGSPMLNDKAELVGLAFDGNYEGIASGWLFNEKLTRTIGVDARYMLWIMDAIDQADRLLEEMKLKPEL